MDNNCLLNDLKLNIHEGNTIVMDEKWKHENINSPYNRIYFFQEGQAYIINEFEKIILKPGYVYLIPCNFSNSYFCPSYAKKFYLHFNLENEWLLDYFSHFKKINYFEISIDKIKIIEKLFEASTLAEMILFRGEIMRILSRFVKKNEKQIFKQIQLTSQLKEMITYIENNLDFSLNVSKIVYAFNMSYPVINEKFKKVFGVSLKVYIDLQILKRAKFYFHTTDKSIKEVADILGFDDPLYFSKFFKKYERISPKKYKGKRF